MFDFTKLSLVAGPAAAKAAALFAEEIALRTQTAPSISEKPLKSGPFVCFEQDESLENDEFVLKLEEERPSLTIMAEGTRGFIYGYSMFLRKTTYIDGKITLITDPSGRYSPDKPIRGHQLGYRPKNNTYDAWTPEHYARYYRDMMAFGSNMCELMPPLTDDRAVNELMKYPADEMLITCSALADELDLDVSIWYPNCEESTVEESAEIRKELLGRLPRVDVIFPPGGDPGDYPAEEFIERCIAAARKVKEVHPNVEMWPSAQRPKRIRDWGEKFIKEMEALPPEINGVITGPNRAFDIEVLRRRLPMQYPIRLYPDITHNVRCEWPVHFPRDDWHFAFAATMGRESINPRPVEFREVYRMFSRYTCGGVSYSEGSNDDINKMVWGWMDYAPDTPVVEILEDYARFFFPGADAERIAEGILALEKNWYGDPAENPLIEATLSHWEAIAAEHPELMQNWRFVMCLFRARGDAVIRRRRIFENRLVSKANKLLKKASTAKAIEEALDVLNTPYEESYQTLRASLYDLAQMLFDTIGIQLDVANFKAAAPDRGATLDTIDQPITDRKYLITRLSAMQNLPEKEQQAALNEFLAHDALQPDEFAFSVAVDGLERFGGKPVDAYLNFRGDSLQRNNGQIPMSLIGLYDHFFFHAEIGGFLPGQDYELRIITSDMLKKELPPTDFVIKANGHEIFRGDYKTLVRDEEYERAWLGESYCAVKLELPAEVFENGCLFLELEEKRIGIEFAEIRITRK
jgi:hypothetical protein